MNAQPVGLIRRVDRKLDGWITGWNPYDPAKLKDKGVEPVVIEESEVRRKGARWFIIAFVLFMGWATTMPIDSGVPVGGNVVVSGYRKAVQHPSGGVVQQILVREGAKVKQGDVLIKVNPLNTEANLTNYELQYLDLLVNDSRLRAERAGHGSISWTPELSKFAGDPRLVEAKAVQTQLFNARRAEYQSQISGLQAQIEGLQSAISSHRIQLQTLNEELRNSEELARDGFVPKSQVNTTLRNKAEQEAALANATSEIAKLRAQIAQTRTAYLKEIESQLSEIQKNRDAYSTRLSAARFDQELTQIRAPVSGTVVGLKVFTVGGVIQAGQVLAEVVPEDGSLIAETKIPPALIDKVKVDLEADIRFLAFNQATTPVIEGKVKLVGVDLLVPQDNRDPTAPPQYYLAQVEVTEQGMKDLADLKVQPGMPVDVIIKTGERTFMSYLLKPLTDKLARAFKD